MPQSVIAASAISVACQVEVAVLGQYVEGEAVHLIKGMVTGKVYENGDWIISCRDLNDPMIGESVTGSGGLERFRVLWRMFALLGSVISVLALTLGNTLSI